MKSGMRAVDDRLDLSDIGLPRSVGFMMRVRIVQTERYSLSANITFCHTDLHLRLYKLHVFELKRIDYSTSFFKKQ